MIKKHDKFDRFDEEFARLLLFELFKEDFYDSKLSEHPDIVNENKSIGVEVTSAFNQKLQERESVAIDTLNKKRSELTDLQRHFIDENYISINIGKEGRVMLAGAQAYTDPTYDIKTVIIKKLEKLNKDHFYKFKHNRLFIEAHNLDSGDIKFDHAFDFIHTIDFANYKNVFEIIYVYSCERLYIFDYVNKHISVKELDIKSLPKLTKQTRINLGIE